MATITRGTQDEIVGRLKAVLDQYEAQHPGAVANLYRQNSGSIRIRIVDDRFSGLSKAERHDDAWGFISDRISEDDAQEISVLLLLSPSELSTSFLNAEFNDPVKSEL